MVIGKTVSQFPLFFIWRQLLVQYNSLTKITAVVCSSTGRMVFTPQTVSRLFSRKRFYLNGPSPWRHSFYSGHHCYYWVSCQEDGVDLGLEKDGIVARALLGQGEPPLMPALLIQRNRLTEVWCTQQWFCLFRIPQTTTKRKKSVGRLYTTARRPLLACLSNELGKSLCRVHLCRSDFFSPST